MPGVTQGGAYSLFTVTNVFDGIQQAGFRRIPRYLYRVHGPFSAGITSKTEVCSPAVAALRHEHGSSAPAETPAHSINFSSLRPEQATAVLNNHLRWRCCDPDIVQELGPCNLMSWTSSLLFALQYALYRHGHNEWKYAREDLSKIKILMIDTSAVIDKKTSILTRYPFIRDLQAIKGCIDKSPNDALEQLHGWRNTGDFYYGEYLSQGRLALEPEHCHEVTMGDLIGRGLFEVCPGLDDREHWCRWAKRVNGLRRVPLRCCSATPHDLDILGDTLDALVRVAGAFGSFRGPVAIHLLGLSRVNPRIENARNVVQVFQERLPEALHNVCTGSITLGDDMENLPELERCKGWYAVLSRLTAINADEMRMQNEAARREGLAGGEPAAARANDDVQPDSAAGPEHEGPAGEESLDEMLAALALSGTGQQ